MFCTDNKWHSDFVQEPKSHNYNGLLISPYNDLVTDIRLYRYSGKIKPAMADGAVMFGIKCGDGLIMDGEKTSINVMNGSAVSTKVYNQNGSNFKLRISNENGEVLPKYCYEETSYSTYHEIKFFSVREDIVITKSS